MKIYYILLVFVFSLVSCKKEQVQETNNTITSSTPLLEGTWELVSYYNYIDDKIKDSSITNDAHRQVKMFTKDKVMWSKKRVADSTEWFAYGSYTIVENNLKENLEYGSKTMDDTFEERSNMEYELILTDTTFSQIQMDEEGHRIYSENYSRIK